MPIPDCEANHNFPFLLPRISTLPISGIILNSNFVLVAIGVTLGVDDPTYSPGHQHLQLK